MVFPRSGASQIEVVTLDYAVLNPCGTTDGRPPADISLRQIPPVRVVRGSLKPFTSGCTRFANSPSQRFHNQLEKPSKNHRRRYCLLVSTFNIKPRPRVLFEDVPKDLLAGLVRLVPSFQLTFAGDDVHETEYDLLVTFASDATTRGKHLHVLSFGANLADSARSGSMLTHLHRDVGTLASEVSICSGTPTAVADLLKSTVIPHIPDGQKATWHLLYPDPYGVSWQDSITGDLEGHCIPLLHLGPEQFVYAFSNRRDGNSGGLHLSLPGITQNPAEWLRLFLDLVAAVDPNSVPSEIEWKSSERWSPPEVSDFVKDLHMLRQEHEQAMCVFQVQEQALKDQLEDAAKRADSGPGRLLTADGDELSDAVLKAMQDLGFGVRDMDDHHDERTGAKLEDLRVDDPKAPGWHCLVEVKGYTKGAKVNDVSQITGRPVAAYTKETGDFPSAVWHIVNAWRGTPPSTRPVSIPNDDDLKPLTDAGGALIDTRDLFEAWRDVRAGLAEAEDVRVSLRSAVTRWTYELLGTSRQAGVGPNRMSPALD